MRRCQETLAHLKKDVEFLEMENRTRRRRGVSIFDSRSDTAGEVGGARLVTPCRAPGMGRSGWPGLGRLGTDQG